MKKKSATKTRILVAAEQPAMGKIISVMLMAAGYECEPVSNRSAAVPLLDSTKKFDLLLFHVASFEVEAGLLAATMRKRTRDIPMILTAAREWLAVPPKIRKRGRAFLQMPFEREKLIDTVRGALQ